MKLFENYSLKDFNTFQVVANCSYFTEIHSLDDFHSLPGLSIYPGCRKMILGGGSNVLFTSDFDGLIIKNCLKGIGIIDETADTVIVTAASGEIWHDLVMFCVGHDLYGIENLALIPGTVGAAPVQNIGAYGAELKDSFLYCDCVDINDVSINRFYKKDCNFGYRESIFKKDAKDVFITSVTLELNKHKFFNTSYSDIRANLKEIHDEEITLAQFADIVIQIREAKLPDPKVYGNAGSFFKNPQVTSERYKQLSKDFPTLRANPSGQEHYKIAAAWLIEQSGWKGKRIGDVGTHPVQPLVIINYGGASGLDILHFASEIQDTVKDKFNIQLEFEVNIIK
jgi:UDP-N-acetylmuramate dehydrogenase